MLKTLLTRSAGSRLAGIPRGMKDGIRLAALSCVWIPTGNANQPLACIWIDREMRFLAQHEPGKATGEFLEDGSCPGRGFRFAIA